MEQVNDKERERRQRKAPWIEGRNQVVQSAGKCGNRKFHKSEERSGRSLSSSVWMALSPIWAAALMIDAFLAKGWVAWIASKIGKYGGSIRMVNVFVSPGRASSP